MPSSSGFRLIALLTLPLPGLGAYLLGRTFAGWIPDLELEMPLSGLLSILGYLLVLLGCIVVWAAALWPLRLRAGFAPLSDDLQKIRKAGGLASAIAEEQKALQAQATSGDPDERASYHLTFGLVSALHALAGAGMSWALWGEGYIWGFARHPVAPGAPLDAGDHWQEARPGPEADGASRRTAAREAPRTGAPPLRNAAEVEVMAQVSHRRGV